MTAPTGLRSRGSIAVVTTVTMIAFASNSILCRLALGDGSIDPVGFTGVRLLSGAIALLVIARLGGRRRTADRRGTWASGLALFVYALGFSLAYVRLEAGTGALLLFGFVQITMIASGLLQGERPGVAQWGGLVVASVGLVVLVSPGLRAPSLRGSLLMALAGIAWGVYSLRGRGAADPIVSTTDNFVRAVPMILIVMLAHLDSLAWSTRGVALAMTSGAIASGCGYVLWYVALRGLTATGAATVQLTVPVFAAIGGVALLAEAITTRIVVASVAVLGGVAWSLVGGRRETRP